MAAERAATQQQIATRLRFQQTVRNLAEFRNFNHKSFIITRSSWTIANSVKTPSQKR